MKVEIPKKPGGIGIQNIEEGLALDRRNWREEF